MNEYLINKKDLIDNINIIKKLADKSLIIAVVKYNGYGLGLCEYVEFLKKQDINYFAVASVEEALLLRKEFKDINILNMSSTSLRDEIEKMIKNNITISIGSKECFDLVKDLSKNKKVNVHIKVDTGFGRYGFLPEDIDVMKDIINTNNIIVEGIFSHFSSSFNDYNYTKKQYDTFINVVKELETNFKFKIKHICNSSAFLQYKEMHLDAVRIGSAFLGRLTIPNKYKLKKIGIFKTHISEIKTLPKNHFVGYGNIFKTNKDMKVAIIPSGMIDGINLDTGRNRYSIKDKINYILHDIKNDLKGYKHFIMIDSKKYQVIGGIDMSHIVIDITGSHVKIGDEVLIEVNPLFVNPNIKRVYK